MASRFLTGAVTVVYRILEGTVALFLLAMTAVLLLVGLIVEFARDTAAIIAESLPHRSRGAARVGH